MPCHTLAYHIHKVAFLMDKLEDRLLQRDFQMSLPQFRMLLAIDDKTVCQREIAEFWGTTQAAVSRQIDYLVEHEFVSREENSENRRQYSLVLTKKGKKLLENMFSIIEQEYAQIYEHISATERNSLTASLQKMITAITNYSPKGGV